MEALNDDLACLALPSELLENPTGAPLPLQKLALYWPGLVSLLFQSTGFSSWLPALRKMAVFGASLLVSGHMHSGGAILPPLTDFSLIDGDLQGAPDGAWLPPTLTALVLSNDHLQQLPGVLGCLPRLRR